MVNHQRPTGSPHLSTRRRPARAPQPRRPAAMARFYNPPTMCQLPCSPPSAAPTHLVPGPIRCFGQTAGDTIPILPAPSPRGFAQSGFNEVAPETDSPFRAATSKKPPDLRDSQSLRTDA